MSKTKSISDLVTELQHENDRLQVLSKLFDKACKAEFGLDVEAIHKVIEKQKLYEQIRAEHIAQQSSASQNNNIPQSNY